jgi:hypothetical protein|tara:strand:- start:659 stop:877 length:219 start_codon:yes stop_codon:yes gene_type:complete
MKHWKTKEDMGGGFTYNQKDHKKLQYNSLAKVKPHEKNTMRTCYLIRDVWTNEQVLTLFDYITFVTEEREEG